MSKKVIFLTLGILTLVASAIMYNVGSNNSRLTELLDFFWIPIPLGILLIAIAFKKKAKPPEAKPTTTPEPQATEPPAEKPPTDDVGSGEQQE